MATITGTPGDDVLTGTSDQDIIYGLAGDDEIDGAAGDDIVFGGQGSDTIIGGDGADSIDAYLGGVDLLEGGVGNDRFSVYWDQWSGSGLVVEPGAVFTARGGTGDDNFLAQVGAKSDAQIFLEGGEGNDRFAINGLRTMTLTLGAGQDVVEILDTNLPNNTGDVAPAVVTDFEVGTGGDRLDWIDFLHGMLANYDRRSNPFATGHVRLVESAGDTIVQVDFDGAGTALGFTDYFRLIGVQAADLTAFNLGGYSSDGTVPAGVTISGTDTFDWIEGSAGDDHIEALGGTDVVSAGPGNDAVWGGDGWDQLEGQSGDDVLYGESSEDQLDGGSGNDRLDGGAGNDRLYGGAGNDALSGGAGNDTMLGGAGNDVYYVDSVGDVLIEAAGEGTDIVYASASHTLAANVERVYLASAAALNGTGNALDNLIVGNAASNRLEGGAGNDRLEGGAGNDALSGGAGNDTMLGGAGNDVYYVGSAGDVVTEAPGDGTDIVYASASHTLAANVERVYLSGAALDATGNALDNVIVGNAAGNRLNGAAGNDWLDGGDGGDVLSGGAGNDTMLGGAGNDLYYIDSTSDVITEAAGGGTDIVYASASYTLSANVERVYLSGGATDATGNALDNVIVGNAAGNRLNGAAGNDWLDGGAGNDVYYVDSANDVITETVGGGSDTVNASVSYALAASVQVEFMSAADRTSRTAINLTGNALDNTIHGNAGNNILDGGTGADKLYGLEGDDFYYVDSLDDRVFEGANGGNDRVLARASYTLGSGTAVEILTTDNHVGTAVINLTGNEFANIVHGNAGDNVLEGRDGDDAVHGGAGNDIMLGGGGNDRIFGDGGFDKLIGDAGSDQLWGGAGTDWFVFKGLGALDGVDRINDFQDGTDLVVLERLGITQYAAGGGNGTVFAQDAADGGVIVRATTSDGLILTVEIADPLGNLSAANFSATDFLFA